MVNLGHIASSILHFDPTPGFNIDAHAGGGIPFISRGNGSTGQAPRPAATAGSSVAPSANSNDTPIGTYGSGIYSGSGSGTTANTALANAYGQQIGTFQNLLNGLGGQEAAQRTILDGGYNAGRSSLDTSHNRAIEDLTQQRNQVAQNRSRSLGDLASRGRNLVQSLNNQFGTMGAGSSSASQILAPFAIAQQQNRLGGDINHQANDQFQAIDTQTARTEQDYKTSLDSLEQDRLQKLMDLGAKFNDLKNQYIQGLQTATAQQAQALNGAYTGAVADVNAAVQGIESNYNKSLSDIQNYYSSYQPQVQQIAAPTNNVQALNTAGFDNVAVDPSVSQQQLTAAFYGGDPNKDQTVLQ